VRFADTFAIVREYGVEWAYWRARYEVWRRSGRLRAAFPPVENTQTELAKAVEIPVARLTDFLLEQWAERGGRFFLPANVCVLREAIAQPETVVRQAEDILAGKLRFFHRSEREVGNPPDWFLAAKEGARWPADWHWSQIHDLTATWGDIKYVWEPSRFTHTFTLARAYALTGDERYPQTFWMQVEDWIAANQPERGPHWRCGQEMALRCLAWIFGLMVFRRSRAATPERQAALISQLWYHGGHIEKIHWYAKRCVRNNHAMSETIGLFTIGALFPFLPGAARWREQGLPELLEEADWQFYADGAYIQHSMNYQRLVTQLFTWAFRLAQVNAMPLPKRLRQTAVKSLQFLTAFQDTSTGRLPNYGANDGALLFPLASCDYRDYRPMLNALALVLGEPPLYPPGPWDEEAAWFVGGVSAPRLVEEFASQVAVP
jgi:hypothetical protein